ncbi:heteromeric transposase endonuclease subunit TnsA [Duganella sp. HH101]|uniref:heteromeric transposase endonuclease subunit TnsA n=1 Tax=Duganella sp. HH101 TaxID=1781066 RepID=UPI000875A2E1|nr:heteromeric transposase endonuclease subunit TnsA [Duganella sp. HH101]
MPVRKIPKNYLVVTGSFAGRKNREPNAFESLLEKEYMLLLDFDNSVLHYEVQPVKIPVPGTPRGYTPDILIHFKPDPATNFARRPLLAEVKHSEYLTKYEEKYKPKFSAAEAFVQELDWEFRKVTEIDIRTPRLTNLKFLREYRSVEPSTDDLTLLEEVICSTEGKATANQLLQTLAATDDERMYWLPIIWHAVISGFFTTDLNTPISHDSILSQA